MGPAQRTALLEQYRQFLINEDDAGIERVLAEAPDNPEFVSALSEIHRWYEEEFGLTPAPEDQQEGLEQLQVLLGTHITSNSTTETVTAIEAASPLTPENVDLEPTDSFLGGDGAHSPSPSTRSPSGKGHTEPTRRRGRPSSAAKNARASPKSRDRSPVFKANAYQKGTLAARIVSALYNESSFGDVKFQKVIYVVEHHARLGALQSSYKRYGHGPHDNQLFNGVKGTMKKNGWFEAVRENGRTYFKPLDDPEGFVPTYQKIWGDYEDKIQEVIELFRPLLTRPAEIAATLYAVWNDYLIEGRSFQDADLVHEARHNWDPKKKAIHDREWYDGLSWLRKVGLIPTGFGKLTKRVR